MNKAIENYLKEIYELTIQEEMEFVKLSALAKSMKITPQSVNEMIRKLDDEGMVEFRPYSGVSLTKKGKAIAVSLIRTHRVWEAFLLKELRFPEEQLHEQADLLEHVSTPEMINRLYAYLGEPQYCHHGHPIPRADGTIPPITHYSLWEEEVGCPLFITKIQRTNTKHLPVNVHETITILAHEHDAVTIRLMNSEKIQLTREEAKSIFVK